MSPEIPTPAQAEPPLPPQASPVAHFVLAIRSSLSIAAESGLFRSPEAGVKTLFQSVMELVAELRGDGQGEDPKGLPDILDALLEAVTGTNETQAGGKADAETEKDGKDTKSADTVTGSKATIPVDIEATDSETKPSTHPEGHRSEAESRETGHDDESVDRIMDDG